MQIPKDQIKGVECKHIAYQTAVDRSGDDLILIKEVIHTVDGKLYPNIRLVENYKRPFYITKQPYRNHSEKKEYEDIDKLDRYECTQSELATVIQRALGIRFPNPKATPRQVCRSPYVYFADVSPATIIKAKYKDQCPGITSRNRVAVLDIESDVVYETNEPISVSITLKNIVLIGIAKWWADMHPGIAEDINKVFKEELSAVELLDRVDGKNKMIVHNLIKDRDIKCLDICIGDTPGIMLAETIKKVHKYSPDFLAIWNMDYDIPKIMTIFEREGIYPGDVFSDPKVPPKYRRAKYRQAKAIRETESKSISQHPADLWHVLECPAGFYVIDAMCLFKSIRIAEGNEPTYKLEAILNKHLGTGKLKFNEVKAAEGSLKWHIEMQGKYKPQYIVYNIFDCISVELLDEKTNDMGITAQILTGNSEYSNFKSLPRVLVDRLSYFYLDRNKVPGTVGPDITHPLDEDVIGTEGHIVTLPGYMVEDNGICCIEELPEQRTAIRMQVGDDQVYYA